MPMVAETFSKNLCVDIFETLQRAVTEPSHYLDNLIMYDH